MNDQEFDAAVKEFTDPAGVHHEAFKNNFVYKPELKEKFDSLFKNHWPEESVPPTGSVTVPIIGTLPGAPQSEPAPKAPAENWPAPPAEPVPAMRDDYAVAEEHLRHEWGDGYEANWKMVEAGRDSVFNKADPGDERIYDAVLRSPLGNDPQFLKMLRDVGKEPLPSNVPDISRFSEQQRRDMAGAVAMDLLRHTGVPVNANHPIIRQLFAVLDEKQLIDWGARLHQRLYRR
jgi:hypothetical protein